MERKLRPDDSAIATAYNNVALTWIREGEWRKARAWLTLRPNDSKSIYNLKLIKDKLSALPPPVSVVVNTGAMPGAPPGTCLA